MTENLCDFKITISRCHGGPTFTKKYRGNRRRTVANLVNATINQFGGLWDDNFALFIPFHEIANIKIEVDI